MRYRSIDKDGNVETTRTCTVRIDGERPVTSARAASVRRGARVTLRYRVDDLTPTANVRLVVRTRGGRTRATLRLGRRGTNVLRAASWRCTLARGAYASPSTRPTRPATARPGPAPPASPSADARLRRARRRPATV